MWSVALRSHHRSNEGLMTLGLIRLHGLHAGELGRNFLLSQPAAEVLRVGEGEQRENAR